MQVVTLLDNIQVMDNCFYKPIVSGAGQRFSIPVIYYVDNIPYYGQFEFDTHIWSTIPGDDHKRQFYDRHVSAWFYAPGTAELLAESEQDVKDGKNEDTVTRQHPYIPNEDNTGECLFGIKVRNHTVPPLMQASIVKDRDHAEEK